VSPLTDDAATIAALVESLGTELMPAQGSRADRALALARELLQRAGVTGGDVLLITDAVDWRDAEAATALRVQGLRVSVLGVGTPEGAPIPLAQGGLLEDGRGGIVMARLDETPLRELARRGGGRYAGLRVDDADLDVLLPQGGAAPLAQSEATSLSADLWEEEGPWLLLPLCLLAALAFRRGWVGVLLFAALPLSAQALEWDALWRRDDQRGVAALADGDAAGAAGLFADPEWKGSALYRAGRYEESAQAFAALDSARAHYNRGNALARAGRIPEAIEAYERALALDPGDEDARHNLELLRERMPPQPQQGGPDDRSGQGQPRTQEPQGEQGPQSEPGRRSEHGPEGETGGPDEEGPRGAPPGRSAADGRPPQDPEDAGGADAQSGDGTTPAGAAPASSRTPGMASLRDPPAEQDEAARAMEQWLRRIPDDPGGLLRRKFLYQYRQQQRAPEEEQPW
jgi:Ca-activated chloride channel family protein